MLIVLSVVYLLLLLFLTNSINACLQPKQHVCLFHNGSNIFLTINFKHFDFIEWFDLNSSSNSLFEILRFNKFLVDFSICLFILFMNSKILKPLSLGLILIN